MAFALLVLVSGSVALLVYGDEVYGWRVVIAKLSFMAVGTIAGFWVGHFASAWRVPVAFIVVLAAFWFVNWWDCLFPTSFDMNARCGIPFDRWQYGDFVGLGEGILLPGLLGDMAVGLGVAAVCQWLVDRAGFFSPARNRNQATPQ